MFTSKAVPVTKVTFPNFKPTNLYMHQIDLANPKLPYGFESYEKTVQDMLRSSPVQNGVAYLTISAKVIQKGQSHRRGGLHVDGNYGPNKGSSPSFRPGPSPGFRTSTGNWGEANGGMLLCSTHTACRGVVGTFNELPADKGDCSHLEEEAQKLNNFLLEPNVVYLTNSAFVHESLPVADNVPRQLIRITLPETAIVL